MEELMDGCVKPVRGPMLEKLEHPEETIIDKFMEEAKMFARVGKEAPDFEATAFVANQGFKNIKLSDYKGKWIVICFYPGDFTFV